MIKRSARVPVYWMFLVCYLAAFWQWPSIILLGKQIIFLLAAVPLASRIPRDMEVQKNSLKPYIDLFIKKA